MWHWMGDGWGMGWGLGMVVMFAFWVLVVMGALWLVRTASDRRVRRAGPQTRETPLEILQRRYASGDIARDEYEQKRRDLGADEKRSDR
jgi:putative membrane protein